MRGWAGRCLAFVRANPLVAMTAGAFVLAVLVVVMTLASHPVTADGQRYRDMARSLWETGSFRADYMAMEAPQPGEVENGHTHYFSPLWPAFMVPFGVVFGDAGFEAAFIVATGGALLAAWLATRSLYGDASAFAVVAVLAVWMPRLALQRTAEPLAMAFFVVMLYGVLRSVRPAQDHWILLAGVAAGFAYLTRASVGWLFLVGVAAGFVWRIAFHGRRAVNRYYAAAIGIFVAMGCVWAVRNAVLFWDGTLGGLPHALAADAVFEWKFQRALAEPLRLAWLIPAKAVWGLVLLSPLFVLRGRDILHQLRSLGDETQSGLFLAWSVPLALGAVVAAVFTIADFAPPSPLLNLDNVRYFVFAVPGLVWGPWSAATPALPAGADDASAVTTEAA